MLKHIHSLQYDNGNALYGYVTDRDLASRMAYWVPFSWDGTLMPAFNEYGEVSP